MKRMNHASKTDWLAMPRKVDGQTFEQIGDRILHTDANTRVVLDFADTHHIDFRALRRFGDRVRRMEQPCKPLWLEGLNPYCKLIFRFSFEAEHWELFRDAEGTGDPSGNRPTAYRSLSSTGKGWVPWEAVAKSWAPHLN